MTTRPDERTTTTPTGRSAPAPQRNQAAQDLRGGDASGEATDSVTEKALTLDMVIDLLVGRAAVLRFLHGSRCRVAAMMPGDRAGAVGRHLGRRGANQ